MGEDKCAAYLTYVSNLDSNNKENPTPHVVFLCI